MSTQPTSPPHPHPHYPRIIITYCTQCKWLLRAAYHAQELLSTFSTSLGEVSLRPATGGAYYVDVEVAEAGNVTNTYRSHRIWDRKAQDGFPETKILKRLVRDIIEPGRGLGHVDREYGSAASVIVDAAAVTSSTGADVGADAGTGAGLGGDGDTLSVAETKMVARDGSSVAAGDVADVAATVVESQIGKESDSGAKARGDGVQCEDCV